MDSTPIVAVVGRPNVGKSTLANRIAGAKIFLTMAEPGVTRDRKYALVTRYEKPFTVVDTGGFPSTLRASGPKGIPDEEEALLKEVRRQAEEAIAEADLIILLTDGRAGLHPYDQELARLLRKSSRRVVLAVNKIDSLSHIAKASDFYKLGFEELYPISAEHGLGVPELIDAIIKTIPDSPLPVKEESVRMAVVGRPNVGKSCLVNRILGYERVIVHETPGTTRDPVDTPFELEGRHYLLIDTAGIRRRTRITKELEEATVRRALKSMDRCQVALIVLDATEAATDQDLRIAGQAVKKGKAPIIVVNKWDLVLGQGLSARDYVPLIKKKFAAFGGLPIITVSALTGLRVRRLLKLADEVFAQYCQKVPTHKLNVFLADLTKRYQPPTKLTYIVQAETRPPTFAIFAKDCKKVTHSYQRYLENKIRSAFGFDNVPIRLIFKSKGQGDGAAGPSPFRVSLQGEPWTP